MQPVPVQPVQVQPVQVQPVQLEPMPQHAQSSDNGQTSDNSSETTEELVIRDS